MYNFFLVFYLGSGTLFSYGYVKGICIKPLIDCLIRLVIIHIMASIFLLVLTITIQLSSTPKILPNKYFKLWGFQVYSVQPPIL